MAASLRAAHVTWHQASPEPFESTYEACIGLATVRRRIHCTVPAHHQPIVVMAVSHRRIGNPLVSARPGANSRPGRPSSPLVR